MRQYLISETTLKRLANAIREVSGSDRTYTPSEMVDAVSTILETGAYVLIDENGDEIQAVFVDKETSFDATANDIREGMLAVTDDGVVTGEKVIPSYNTTEGFKLIISGIDIDISIPGGYYDFTKLQALVCKFNTTLANSTATEKVAINDKVYAVNSPDSIADVSIDPETESIKLGITNDTGSHCVVRFITYKEEL